MIILKSNSLFPRALLGLLLLALLAPTPGFSAKAKSKSKVKKSKPVHPAAVGIGVQGLGFVDDGKSWALKGVEVQGLYRLSPDQLDSFFKNAKESGANVVKTNAFSTGFAGALQPGPNQSDEKALAQLDRMVAAAQKSGLKLLLSLCADQGAEGSKAAYATWVGSPNPGVFFMNYQCEDWYKNYVKALLVRVNGVTGVRYGMDPTILGWDLIDSPSCAPGDGDSVNQWVSGMASYVKSLSPNSLILLTLDPKAPGISPDELAGQSGLNFIVERPTDAGRPAWTWNQQIGKPVLYLLGKPSPSLKAAQSGFILAASPLGTADSWAPIQQAFALLPQGETSGYSVSVSTLPGEGPALDWEAQQKIEVDLPKTAKVSIRYGLSGKIDQETPLSEGEAVSHQIVLSGLSAGKSYTCQAKVVDDSGTHYSNPLIFTAPQVRALTAPPPIPMSNNFITVQGTHFYDGDKPFRFVGTNNYYLHFATPASLEYVMSWAEKLGFTVMRTWAFGETDLTQLPDWEKRNFFVKGPGQFVEQSFKDLDLVVDSAKKHNIRLVLAPANNWADYGGAPMWAKYFGSSDKNDFFDKPEIKKAFKDYLFALVNHVNAATGVALKDDPTIMAWDLMNEPRDEKDPSGKALLAWITEMSTYLKSLGVKQLVTVGSEGLRAEGGTHYSGTDFILDHQPSTIDYATFHIYPAGDYARWDLDTTAAIIRAYVKDAHEVLKKPVVMEEFGIDKGKEGYDRPLWIYQMLKVFYAAGGEGTGYWMLAEPTYGGDSNQLDPTQTDVCNEFVLQSEALREEK